MLYEMATIYKKAWGREPLDIVVAAKRKICNKISSALGQQKAVGQPTGHHDRVC